MAGTDKTDEYGQLAESFWQLDHKMAPKNIYHYCISESSKSIIENNSLWVSAFECMNDNKEFRHGMALAKSEVEKNLSALSTNKTQEMQKSWSDFIDREASNPLLRPYVISFCEDPKNQHLWEEYANKHQGTLLQFSNGSHEKSLVNGVFLKVSYNEMSAREELKRNLDKATTIFQKNNNINELQDLFLAYLQVVFKFSISLKEPIWHKEKEWRFVILKDTKNKSSQYGDVKFRHRNMTLIDYLEVDLKTASLQIDGITIGSRFPEESMNSIKIFIRNFSHIKLSI